MPQLPDQIRHRGTHLRRFVSQKHFRKEILVKNTVELPPTDCLVCHQMFKTQKQGRVVDVQRELPDPRSQLLGCEVHSPGNFTNVLMSRLVMSKSPGHGLFMHTKSDIGTSKQVSRQPQTPLSEVFAIDSLHKQIKMLESTTSQLTKTLALQSAQREKSEAELNKLRLSQNTLVEERESAFEAVELLNSRVDSLTAEVEELQLRNSQLSEDRQRFKHERDVLADKADEVEQSLRLESRRSMLLAAELRRSEDERATMREELRRLTDRYETETNENFKLKQQLVENQQQTISSARSSRPSLVRGLSRQELTRLEEIEEIRNLN